MTDTPLPISDRHDPAHTGAVLVSETFVSIQGEGKLTGVPSWFCRLSGCNLRCRWCDTPYASWNPEGTKRTVDDLLAEARASGVRHAVLTGGEPMIFPQLIPLTHRLRDAGIHVTIETAGTTIPTDAPTDTSDRSPVCDLMSLSPKLANSTPLADPRDPTGAWATRHEQRRLNVDTLQRLIDTAPDRQLKFVVTTPADLIEIDELLNQLAHLAPDDIVLMPEGVTVPDPASIAWVIETCTARGWRYGHRLHIELFGDTRGT